MPPEFGNGEFEDLDAVGFGDFADIGGERLKTSGTAAGTETFECNGSRLVVVDDSLDHPHGMSQLRP